MLNKISSFLLFLVFSSSLQSQAKLRDRDFLFDRNKKEDRVYEKVKWIGYIEADAGHTTKHYHDVRFVKKSNNQGFDIINSPMLEKAHCASEKRLLVEIEAERTPKFLFWGNNLIVKKFKILKELEAEPHKKEISRDRFKLWDRIDHI